MPLTEYVNRSRIIHCAPYGRNKSRTHPEAGIKPTRNRKAICCLPIFCGGRQYGIVDEPKKEGLISRAISGFFDRRDNREKQLVNKKKYMLLMLLGMFGAHRFYAKQYVVGIFYLATCWLGISLAMTFIDILVVIPMPPDENGNILL